jgi:2-keto-4-pentenoate hydratase/2-oxohepta-3-ene-1,7-dioic acid hydratase in catechol pathway
LNARLWVNGKLRQNANTRDLIVDIPGMIELASRVATLEPGDIIATGTPEGVGPIVRGDTVRIAIDHLGEMSLKVQ